ncbi:MMPL family transporter [Gallibacterium trehalosifermentans]|uniref:MMPL family transporter n=1 Tax=Gallibacterium trehalosifermentans TaxID=516935 RepID=A0ABV6H1X7_9PAST
MNSKFGLTQNKIHLLIWLACVLLSLAVLIKNSDQIKIEGNLTALLGQSHTVPTEVDKQLSSAVNDSLLWLVKAKTLAAAQQAAGEFVQQLSQLAKLYDIQAQDTAQQTAWQQYFFHHRAMLLTPSLKAALTDPAHYFTYIQSQLYSPVAGVSLQELAQDPLLLTRQQLLQQKQRLQSDNGWLYVKYQDDFYLLIRAKTNAQDLNEKAELVEKINQITTQLTAKNEINIYRRGALFFSHAAAESVERDITIIGTGSLLGIILLLLLVFRSLYPFLLLTSSLFTAMLFGTLATWWWFGEIHLLTLGLSSCLIGVSTDYSLHFLVKRFYASNKSTHLQSPPLNGLKVPLIIAFITTALCYGVMLFVPLAILQQMAVFAIFGLFGALFTVMLAYPCLTVRIKPLTFRYPAVIMGYLQQWQTQRWLRAFTLLLFMLSLLLVSRIQINDDVRLLQSRDPALLQDEQIISQVLQQHNELQYFIVQADNLNDLLANSYTLMQLLQQPAYRTALQPALQLENYIQPIEQQQQNYQQIDRTLTALLPQLNELSEEIIDKYPQQTVSFADFLQGEVGKLFRELYQQHQGKHYLLIPLTKSDSQLANALAAQSENISYHNITQEWSDLFQQTRVHILHILLVSVVIVFILLSWCLTWRKALAIVAVLVLAMSLATATLTLTGQYFNLFSALALMLLLGMGIDYGVFMAKAQTDKQANIESNKETSLSFLAIWLSALTTLLSFGLLTLSETKALVSFASVLCVGISCVFIFIPLVLNIKKT